MRLNRVLQLTAGVAIAMAASVFTISCGEDGSDGKPGGDCTITGTSSPFTVVCNGNVAGTLKDGENGRDGLQGVSGANGKSCTVNPIGSSWQISCDGEVKGTLSGCSVTQSTTNIYDLTLNCGGTAGTTVNLCNNKTYDSSEYFCKSDGSDALKRGICGPAKTLYNAEKEYCGFESKTAFTSKTTKVLPLCTNDPVHDQPNYAAQDPAQVALGDTTWYLKGDKDNEWEDEYCRVYRKLAKEDNGKLVGLTSSANAADTNNAITKGFYIDTAMVERSEACGTKANAKYNEKSWKGEYCGYGDAKSNARSVRNNACGSGELPDTDILGRTYCQMRNKTDKLSRLADTTGGLQYCGKMKIDAARADELANKIGANKLPFAGTFVATDYLSAAERKTLNAVSNTGILAPTNFPGEYCTWNKTDVSGTFTDAGTPNADIISFTKVTAKTACGNGVGPNERLVYLKKLINSHKATSPGEAPLWRNEYCQFKQAGSVSEPAGGAEAYCIKQRSTGEFDTKWTLARFRKDDGWQDSLVSKDSSNFLLKMNATSWAKEYCGYESATKYSPAKATQQPERKVLNVICDSNDGNNNDNKPNNFAVVDTLGYFPNQYCQASKTGTTKLVGLFVPRDASGSGPKVSEFVSSGSNKLAGVYCKLDLTSVTSLSDITTAYSSVATGAMINKDKWESKGEYCGYASNATFAPTSGPKTPSKLKGICDDDKGPNEIYATDELGFWGNQFCQATGVTGATVVAGIGVVKDNPGTGAKIFPTNITASDTLLQVYCGDTTTLNAARIKAVAGSATTEDTTAYNTAFLNFFQSATKLNNGSWASTGSASANTLKRGEYCGYTDSSAADKKKFTKQTGRCGTTLAAKGPNQALKFSSWDWEYCQANDAGNLSVVGGSGGSAAYCLNPEKELNKNTAIANNRLNENAWQGQYCFADYVRSQCFGGNVMADGVPSTDLINRCKAP